MIRQRRIGIIGGIGSGKSFVGRVLTEYFGIPVYDSDAHAKELMQTDVSIVKRLRALLGHQVYDSQGKLNRSVVAAYLFASSHNALRINALVHPVVCLDFEKWAQEQHAPLVAVESAVLLQSGLERLVDGLLMVEASQSTRLMRAMQRNNATQEQIQARMALQDVMAMSSVAQWHVQNESGTTKEQIINQIKILEIC